MMKSRNPHLLFRQKADPIWASIRFLGFMMGMMWVILVYLLVDKFKIVWGIR